MTSTIDTLGKAVRHRMVLRAACRCGRTRDFDVSELMMRFGGGRDPRTIRFRCVKCAPLVTGVLFETVTPPAPEKLAAIVWRTLAQQRAAGHTISAHCEATSCWHRAELDLDALAARLGADHGTLHDDLAPLLRCSKCGGRKVGITIQTGGYRPPEGRR